MLEIHADARPGGEAATHAVDEHIGRLQVRGRLGMTLFPSLQSCIRIGLFSRSTDLHERTAGLAPF